MGFVADALKVWTWRVDPRNQGINPLQSALINDPGLLDRWKRETLPGVNLAALKSKYNADKVALATVFGITTPNQTEEHPVKSRVDRKHNVQLSYDTATGNVAIGLNVDGDELGIMDLGLMVSKDGSVILMDKTGQTTRISSGYKDKRFTPEEFDGLQTKGHKAKGHKAKGHKDLPDIKDVLALGKKLGEFSRQGLTKVPSDLSNLSGLGDLVAAAWQKALDQKLVR